MQWRRRCTYGHPPLELSNVGQAQCALTQMMDPRLHCSQYSEDFILLPTLLHLTQGRPGIFVEMGAMDGATLSNTIVLEKCYNWTGVLIEADPHHFNRLLQSGRSAHKVHYSAVCSPGVGHVNLTGTGAGTGGGSSATTLSRGPRKGEWAVQVPCRPLTHILHDTIGDGVVDFLSLNGATSPARPHLWT
jgi:hypothetical protein